MKESKWKPIKTLPASKMVLVGYWTIDAKSKDGNVLPLDGMRIVKRFKINAVIRCHGISATLTVGWNCRSRQIRKRARDEGMPQVRISKTI